MFFLVLRVTMNIIGKPFTIRMDIERFQIDKNENILRRPVNSTGF